MKGRCMWRDTFVLCRSIWGSWRRKVGQPWRTRKPHPLSHCSVYRRGCSSLERLYPCTSTALMWGTPTLSESSCCNLACKKLHLLHRESITQWRCISSSWSLPLKHSANFSFRQAIQMLRNAATRCKPVAIVTDLREDAELMQHRRPSQKELSQVSQSIQLTYQTSFFLKFKIYNL